MKVLLVACLCLPPTSQNFHPSRGESIRSGRRPSIAITVASFVIEKLWNGIGIGIIIVPFPLPSLSESEEEVPLFLHNQQVKVCGVYAFPYHTQP